MSDIVLVALITAVPSTLAAVAAGVALVTKRRVEDLHIAVNSRLTQLLEQSKLASHAEGMQDERNQQGGGPNG